MALAASAHRRFVDQFIGTVDPERRHQAYRDQLADVSYCPPVSLNFLMCSITSSVTPMPETENFNGGVTT